MKIIYIDRHILPYLIDELIAFSRQVDRRLLSSESADWARAHAGHAASQPGGRNEEAGVPSCGENLGRWQRKMVNHWGTMSHDHLNITHESSENGESLEKRNIWQHDSLRNLMIFWTERNVASWVMMSEISLWRFCFFRYWNIMGHYSGTWGYDWTKKKLVKFQE